MEEWPALAGAHDRKPRKESSATGANEVAKPTPDDPALRTGGQLSKRATPSTVIALDCVLPPLPDSLKMMASSSLPSRSPLRGCLRQGLTALP